MAHRSVIPLRVGVLPNQDEAIYNELEGKEDLSHPLPNEGEGATQGKGSEGRSLASLSIEE